MNETEFAVLGMSAGGMTNGEIAFALDISQADLAEHIIAIVSELEVSNIESAIAKAVTFDLLEIEL